MTPIETTPPSLPQAAVVERTALLGAGTSRLVVAMLLGLPVLVWGASALMALMTADH